MPPKCITKCMYYYVDSHMVINTCVSCMLVSSVCERISFMKVSPKIYAFVSLFLLLSGPATYWAIKTLGVDPMWTVNLATRWCAKKEWIYLDTNIFYALTRDASALLGKENHHCFS